MASNAGSLWRLWALWDGRLLVLRTAIVSLALFCAVSFIIPSRYTSSARLMPPDSGKSNAFAMLATVAGQLDPTATAVPDMSFKTTGGLFIGILRSETVQFRIVDRFNLRSVYGKSLASKAREKLDENTSITEDRKSGIITIEVTDRDANRARAMANAYVDELNRVVTERSTSAAHNERVFLETRLQGVRTNLEESGRRLAQFSTENNALDIKEEGKAAIAASAEILGRLAATKTELKALQQTYSDNNRRVQIVQAEVNELRAQLRSLVGKSNAAAMESAHPEDSFSIKRLPLLALQYSDLYRESKIQEAMYETLTRQYELAKVEEARELPSVRILDEPRQSDHRVFPQRLQMTFIGAFAGLIVGMVWVLAVAEWNQMPESDPRKVLLIHLANGVARDLHLYKLLRSKQGSPDPKKMDVAVGGSS